MNRCLQEPRRRSLLTGTAALGTALAAHGGDPAAVAEVCIDVSPAFIKGVGENPPNAAITFDKIHAVQIVNEAVDLLRSDEQKSQPYLKKTRYVWLKNESNLSSGQRQVRDSLASRNLKTARAWTFRLAFQDFYQITSRDAAEGFLKQWYFWPTHSRLPPVIEAARTIKRRSEGILRWFDARIANGLIEGINSLTQAGKAKARGYRSTRNLKAIINLLARKFDLRLPA